MPILINEYFSIVTDESAQHGEDAERGTIAEDVPFAFRELVARMREGEPSCYPVRGMLHEWVSIDQGETRAFFERGERETRTIHYSPRNPPRMARYWRLAMTLAHGKGRAC